MLTRKECAQILKVKKRIVDNLIRKKILPAVSARQVEESDLDYMLRSMSDEHRYQNTIQRLFEIIELFKKSKFQIPNVLKGMIGECLVMKELVSQDHLKNSIILYFGGTLPDADIIVDGKGIQVKTQFPHEGIIKGAKCFSSPTVRKDSWKRFEFLVLVIMKDNILDKPDFYIFHNREVDRYFSPVGCWSGKKGDRTIFFIKRYDYKRVTTSGKKIINHYNTPEYSSLFEYSKGNWSKIRP